MRDSDSEEQEELEKGEESSSSLSEEEHLFFAGVAALPAVERLVGWLVLRERRRPVKMMKVT